MLCLKQEANTTWDKLDKITQKAVRAKKKTLELTAKVLLENATEAVLRDAQVSTFVVHA